METEALFEFTCPECEKGTVRTTRIHNYKTKIKGYPFTVDEALIGVCDECEAQSFAPEETQRWDELFSHSLQARHAFLTPEEITQIRKDLSISMEDFARLIGSTRQSVSMWEKASRTTPPVRTADLLMKLVRQSLTGEPVDVLPFLLDEAGKWGVVIELRRSQRQPARNKGVVLRLERRPKHVISEEPSFPALAAQTSDEEEEQIAAIDSNGKQVGVLSFDYGKAALVLDITGSLPFREAFGIEVETQEGEILTSQFPPTQERRLVLQEKTELRESDIRRIILKPRAAVEL